jgi:16S rRNA (uracil1498-N3)-methyltransferase
MTRRRFYVHRDFIRDGVAALAPSEAHHLREVLRIKSGECVEVFDASGLAFRGEVELRRSEVLVRKLERIASPEPSPFRLMLAAALIKAAKFEWMIEKATELGVDEIIPLKTRHSEINISSEKIGSRLERWQRILLESSKQCRRPAPPVLREPLEFDNLLKMDEFSPDTRILFYEKAVEPWRGAGVAPGRTILCIGPEGGWDLNEVERASEAGYGIFGLGPRVLRAETAAIAAVSILRHGMDLLDTATFPVCPSKTPS